MIELKIRSLLPKDMPTVYEFVKALAIYENSEEQVITDVAIFENLFEEQIFHGLIAENEDHIYGVAIYYYTFSTWKGKVLYLEDFIVDSEFRQQGIGKQIFNHLQQLARKNNCSYMRWQVLDWNTPAIEFYKRYHSTFDEGWINCQLKIE
jgi:GNAT superfamily N-acetyltransferase